MIKTIEFDKQLGSLLVHVHKLSWGNQKGLPFLTGTEESQVTPNSEFVVRFPEEDGGLWLDDLKAPAIWAAENVRFYKRLKSIKPREKLPTPATFAIFSPDDSGLSPIRVVFC